MQPAMTQTPPITLTNILTRAYMDILSDYVLWQIFLDNLQYDAGFRGLSRPLIYYQSCSGSPQLTGLVSISGSTHKTNVHQHIHI